MHNPGNYTIRIEPGNTYSRSLSLTTNGTPYDLTGFSAALTVTDDGLPISGVTPACSVVGDPTDGQISFGFSLDDVEVLDLIEDGRFNLTIRNGDDSIVLTVLKGRLTSNRWSNG